MTPPLNYRNIFTVHHTRLFTVRGDFMGIDDGKWIVVESSGLKRTWKFRPENVKDFKPVRSHKKGKR